MKRILIVCAALLLCGMAAARGRGVHRVVSCNIRVALPQDEEGGNGWSVRKYVCERVMKRCKADIYCLQEVTVGQYEDMCRMFPGYFVFGYPGPETDALPDREFQNYQPRKRSILYGFLRILFRRKEILRIRMLLEIRRFPSSRITSFTRSVSSDGTSPKLNGHFPKSRRNPRQRNAESATSTRCLAQFKSSGN